MATIWAYVVRISRRTSLRVSRVSEMSRSELTIAPPVRELTTSVLTRIASSRDGSRCSRFDIAVSSGTPRLSSSETVCSSVRAGSSRSSAAMEIAVRMDRPADEAFDKVRASSGICAMNSSLRWSRWRRR